MRDVASSSSLVPLPIMAVPDTDLSVPISPFYNGVNVAERQVIVVALFTCTPINSAPPAVIAK